MGKYYDIIIQEKPALTGLWQVEGRSELTFDDRLDLDIKYHKNKSLLYDTKILLKTIEHVIHRKGAM
jgi:undecaprenyl-phosphate galactose phosphotransferase